MREGEFVGHVVSASGHSPLPSLVDKISRAARPGNCKELQRFLGLVNYYREYIPNMADVTQPLYDLTKKGKDWVWDGKCESAFCKLRGILSDSPIVLAYPDWKKEFYLQTDASTIAVGGVLSQGKRKWTPETYCILFFWSLLYTKELFSRRIRVLGFDSR